MSFLNLLINLVVSLVLMPIVISTLRSIFSRKADIARCDKLTAEIRNRRGGK